MSSSSFSKPMIPILMLEVSEKLPYPPREMSHTADEESDSH